MTHRKEVVVHRNEGWAVYQSLAGNIATYDNLTEENAHAMCMDILEAGDYDLLTAQWEGRTNLGHKALIIAVAIDGRMQYANGGVWEV